VIFDFFRTQTCPLPLQYFSNLSCICPVHDLRSSFAILTLHVITVHFNCLLDLSFTSISSLCKSSFPSRIMMYLFRSIIIHVQQHPVEFNGRLKQIRTLGLRVSTLNEQWILYTCIVENKCKGNSGYKLHAHDLSHKGFVVDVVVPSRLSRVHKLIDLIFCHLLSELC